MKIQYCSDLHLEMPKNLKFISDNPIQVFGGILIIAGDLVPIAKKDYMFFRDEIIKLCEPFQKVFWVPGNHEYYQGTYRKNFKESLCVQPFPQIENLFMVDNYVETIGKVRFIFSTLWSHIRPENAIDVKSRLNDFRLIGVVDQKNGETRTMHVCDFNEYHQLGLNFIREKAEKAQREKEDCEIDNIIFVTHHVPTLKNYPPYFIGSEINDAFATDLDEFIQTSGVDFWIHGHHHYNHGGFKIGKTKILCNQMGYVAYNEQQNFDWKTFIRCIKYNAKKKHGND